MIQNLSLKSLFGTNHRPLKLIFCVILSKKMLVISILQDFFHLFSAVFQQNIKLKSQYLSEKSCSPRFESKMSKSLMKKTNFKLFFSAMRRFVQNLSV